MKSTNFIVKDAGLLRKGDGVTPELMARTLELIASITSAPKSLLDSSSMIRRLGDSTNPPFTSPEPGVKSVVISDSKAPFTALNYWFDPGSKVPIHYHQYSSEFQLYLGGAEISRKGNLIRVRRNTLVGTAAEALHATRNNTAQVLQRPVFYLPKLRHDDYHEAKAEAQKAW